jgi:regulatory protein
MIHSSRRSAGDPAPGSSADAGTPADPGAGARSICLQQLTMGPRTRGQLETVLRRRDVDPEVASLVLDRLEAVSLVDDAAFAETFVQSRRAGGLSRRALGHELRAKGVPGQVVEEAIEALDPADELTSARALVARRLPSTRRLEVEVRTRRLVGMLARKGYPSGMAMRVVREALAAERELDSLESRFLDGLDVDLSDAARLGE